MSLVHPVLYLQNNDFDSNGKLLINSKGLPVLLLIQSPFCGYCVDAKPVFQEFAKRHLGKVICTTIQLAGDIDSDMESLSKRIKDIHPELVGIPDFSIYVNGTKMDEEVTIKTMDKVLKYGN